jgi:hypothetical protein
MSVMTDKHISVHGKTFVFNASMALRWLETVLPRMTVTNGEKVMTDKQKCDHEQLATARFILPSFHGFEKRGKRVIL